MIVLLAIAACLLLALLGAVIAWEATHPPRRSVGWALARGLPCDPAELGLAFTEWTLDRPDGAAMPVWDIALPLGDSSPPRPTLILLHGWGRSRIDSLGRLRALLDAAPHAFARALLPELRGHGDASRGPSRLGDGEELDLVALAERVEGPLVLAGHSLGATIAIRAAAADATVAERVKAVIGWAPYDTLATPLTNRLRAAGTVARPFTDVALVMLRVAGIRQPRTDRAARTLRCPLLVVVGGSDPVTPPSCARAIAAAAPQGRCIVLAGGHADAHAVDAEAHRTALAEWLSGTALRPYCGASSTPR